MYGITHLVGGELIVFVGEEIWAYIYVWCKHVAAVEGAMICAGVREGEQGRSEYVLFIVLYKFTLDGASTHI